MSELSVKGFKNTVSFDKFKKFIIDDLRLEIERKSFEYFLSRNTGIEIFIALEVYLKKELDFLKSSLSEMSEDVFIRTDEVIEKYLIPNNSKSLDDLAKENIKKSVKKIMSLIACGYSEKYSEALMNLRNYYKLRDYSTIVDVKFLSMNQEIIIYEHDSDFYFCLFLDDYDYFRDYVVEKGFKDFSFYADLEVVDDEVKVDENKNTEKEKVFDKSMKDFLNCSLEEISERENVWKNIYSDIKVKEENNKKEMISVKYDFNIFSDSFNNDLDENEKSREVLLMINDFDPSKILAKYFKSKKEHSNSEDENIN